MLLPSTRALCRVGYPTVTHRPTDSRAMHRFSLGIGMSRDPRGRCQPVTEARTWWKSTALDLHWPVLTPCIGHGEQSGWGLPPHLPATKTTRRSANLLMPSVIVAHVSGWRTGRTEIRCLVRGAVCVSRRVNHISGVD